MSILSKVAGVTVRYCIVDSNAKVIGVGNWTNNNKKCISKMKKIRKLLFIYYLHTPHYYVSGKCFRWASI